MEQKLDALRAWGCDVETALERMLGDRELLLSCAQMVAEDAGFAALGAHLEAGAAAAAFDVAHSLKGITANTGLMPLYALVVQIVEPLRYGRCEGLLPIYQQLLKKREELEQILA